MSIRYLLRADRAQFHSIEQAFAALFPEISRSFENEVIRMPEAGAGPGSIRKNLHYLKELKAKTGTGERQIWHINGHVNYMALVTGRQTVMTIHDIRSILNGSLLEAYPGNDAFLSSFSYTTVIEAIKTLLVQA